MRLSRDHNQERAVQGTSGKAKCLRKTSVTLAHHLVATGMYIDSHIGKREGLSGSFKKPKTLKMN